MTKETKAKELAKEVIVEIAQNVKKVLDKETTIKIGKIVYAGVVVSDLVITRTGGKNEVS